MVMHARKPSRIIDGFPEKHQTHSHGYENSKYGKYRYGNHEKSRDSPSTNSLRSSSPDSRSQSPRYHKSNYYKVREKDRERERERDRERERERDRDREREYKDYRDRENSRSPKERRRDMRDRDRDRERDHRDSRGLHERANSMYKKEEKERLMRVGEWSEHVSSSGKKYYYNCRTEVSQWEKPPEWLEWERNHRSSVTSASNLNSKESAISSLISHRGQHDKSNRQGNFSSDKHSIIADGYRDNLREVERDRREYRTDERFDRRDHRKYAPDVGSADMDISSGDTTPNSESHHSRNAEISGVDGSGNMASQHPLSASGHTTTHHPRLLKATPSLGPLPASHPNSLPGAVSTLTPLINSNAHTSNNIGPSSSSSISSTIPLLHNSHPRLMMSGNSLPPGSEGKGGGGGINSIAMCPLKGMASSGHDDTTHANKHQLEPLTITPNSNCIGAGPPTPTHSENQDGLDIRKIGSPNSSLNSLQSLSQTPSNSTNSFSLTPSLANYYKETLVSHVHGWPAENIEKQSQRTSEEAHTIGSMMMTKVSAELKMARSLVRLAEIQATLHEQRILFLRAQQRDLEEIKAQNCFMNDT